MESETSGFAIGVAQFAPGADTESNLGEITRLAELAVTRGARLVVFPEYSSYFTPEAGPGWHAASEPVGGPFTDRVAALADRLGIHLVVGLIERIDGDDRRVANTVIAVAPREGVVARYRKLHLYDAFGQRESEWVAPGEVRAPEIFEAGGIRFGLQTCYDARFPEVTRRIVDAGADVVCMPAEWVRGPLKEHHWTTLLAARAIENTAFVVAADHPAPIGVGRSQIIDPQGVVLAGLASGEGVALAGLDLSELERVRTVNPVLRLRRYNVVPR